MAKRDSVKRDSVKRSSAKGTGQEGSDGRASATSLEHKLEQLTTELSLVASERDALRKRLTAIEGMQTETVTLGERDIAALGESALDDAPSIDELMSTLSGADAERGPSHSTRCVHDAEADYQEMISPELILFGSNREKTRFSYERFLVLADNKQTVKFLLDQELMTIGRSDSADIQITGDFVSRIHARVLRIGMDSVIEDAGSKNGTRINGEAVERHVLKHGDQVGIGSAAFRYVDTAQGRG